MIAPVTGNPVIDFVIAVFVLILLWGGFGTRRRRRNLISAFGKVPNTTELVSPERLEKIADRIQPEMLKAYSFRRWAIGFTAFFILLLAAGIYAAANGYIEDNEMLLIGGAAGILIPNAVYRSRLKSAIVPDVASALGFAYGRRGVGIFNRMLGAEDAIVRPTQRQNIFGKSGSLLTGYYDRWDAEDGFDGGNLKFEEIETKNISEGRNSKEETTVFRGLIVEIKVGQPFQCNMIMREDNGKIGNALDFAPKGLERVGLEDTEFESLFEVYAPDQIAARRVLTPRFMEKIKQLAGYYPNAGLSGIFCGDTFYLVVRTYRNLFELGSILTPPDSRKALGGLVAQIELQKQIAESLE